jgi:hypothetical protein
MTKRRATPQEIRDYLKQQEATGPSYGSGHPVRLPVDMSFIDRDGHIVRPNRKDYEASVKKRRYKTK